MKLLKYLGIVILLCVIGYVVFLFVQKKYSSQQAQNTQEKYAIATFEKISSERDLKFSNYQEAKKYFEQKSGLKNIKNIGVNYADIPTMSAPLLVDTKNNYCESGFLNLVTGEFSKNKGLCMIPNSGTNF